MRFWHLAVLAITVMAPSSIAPPPEANFAPGQVWSYRTRAGENSSTLTIVRVDTFPKIGVAVHVSVTGLRLKNHSAGGYCESIPHMPFAENAIRRSVIRKLRDGAPLPNFEAGYNDWRGAFDAGRAGVYTITVAEAVQLAERSLAQ